MSNHSENPKPDTRRTDAKQDEPPEEEHPPVGTKWGEVGRRSPACSPKYSDHLALDASRGNPFCEKELSALPPLETQTRTKIGETWRADRSANIGIMTSARSKGLGWVSLTPRKYAHTKGEEAHEQLARERNSPRRPRRSPTDATVSSRFHPEKNKGSTQGETSVPVHLLLTTGGGLSPFAKINGKYGVTRDTQCAYDCVRTIHMNDTEVSQEKAARIFSAPRKVTYVRGG